MDFIFMPLGGGSSASGACIVAKAVNPQVEVVAVQSEAAPGGYLSWKQGSLVRAPMNTFAEGLATETGYELPQSILRELLDDFVLVSDDQISYAIGLLIEKAHTMAEAAGATAAAGALKKREEIQARKCQSPSAGRILRLRN